MGVNHAKKTKFYSGFIILGQRTVLLLDIYDFSKRNFH